MTTAASPATRSAPARTRISARATLLLVLVIFAATLSISPLRAYLHVRDRQRALERQVAALEASNARAEERIARLNDPAYLERLARSCLGMVEPGEVAFVTVPEEGRKPKIPDC